MKPIIKWQREQLVKELLLLQGHATDPTCPCQTEGEKCVRKHLLMIEALAQETIPMVDSPADQERLFDLAKEAQELRDIEEHRLCGDDVEFPVDLAEWARTRRKDFEALACELEPTVLKQPAAFFQIGGSRVRYDRRDLDSAINAAQSINSKRSLNIFPTYYGYTITLRQPPDGTPAVRVDPDGVFLDGMQLQKRKEPAWCPGVRDVDKGLKTIAGNLSRTSSRIRDLRDDLQTGLNICAGQQQLLQEPEDILVSLPIMDPWGSRCRDPETGHWVSNELCGFAPVAGVSNRTTAISSTGLTRYDFRNKVIDASRLVYSHDPFTFEPNPDYPGDLQPRLRGRAATRNQVQKIAANLDPDSLLTDFHILDRGAPIVGPDNVIESGNGRTMGLVLAASEYPEIYARYRDRLLELAPQYGIKAADIEKLKTPVLVRERLSDVDRRAFTQEANAPAVMAASAIEQARTDAARITAGMIQLLEVGENQSIEDALRSSRNREFINRFMAGLPEQEQARLFDAQGRLNQDGIRRATMAIFTSAFIGDSGLRLAELAFESIDMDVRNVVNAISRSLGPLSEAESLIRAGQRRNDYSISDDLARSATVFSAIKRDPALDVEKYLGQGQLFERELTDFQEDILRFLDKYSRAPRKMANVLRAYAQAVIDSPPPAQVALIPGEELTQADIWAAALEHAEEPAAEPVPALFQDPVDVCREAERVLEKYVDDIRAGHNEAAEFWKGQGQVLAELCLLRRAKMKQICTFQQGEVCELPAPRYRHLASFFTEPAAPVLTAGQPAAPAAQAERKFDQALAMLEQGVQDIRENYRDFLETIAKFHDYSLGNILLILAQKQDARRVAGYKTWQELGRQVKKGERGIMILAPCMPAKGKKPEPPPEPPEEPEEELPELEPQPLYFRVVYVFDISQTEGKELPEPPPVPVLPGEESAWIYEKAADFARKSGFSVDTNPRTDVNPDTMGFYMPSNRLIWVRPEVPQNQRTKTILHELAHALCSLRGAADAEVMAEGVAYSVAAHYDFDTGARSFPYVAVWAEQGTDTLKKNLETIRKVATDMINGIDHLAKLEQADPLLAVIASQICPACTLMSDGGGAGRAKTGTCKVVGEYVHCPVESKKNFDQRSFRTISPAEGVLVTIGCPKGQFDPKADLCKVGTREQRIMYRKDVCSEHAGCTIKKK